MREKRAFFTLCLISVSCLILPACNKYKSGKKDDSQVWNQTHIEARLYDVPVLIGARSMRLLTNPEQGDMSIVRYESTIAANDALLFYQEHMERFGWKQKTYCVGDGEILLNFEKPQKYCSIAIRTFTGKLHIVIFSNQKTVIER